MYFKQYRTILLFALVITMLACSGVNPPYQTLYEAKTAIHAVEKKVGPCPCEVLSSAQQSYEQAKAMNEKGQYAEAQVAATQALQQAQAILRE